VKTVALKQITISSAEGFKAMARPRGSEIPKLAVVGGHQNTSVSCRYC
jgi:hypothetical protein